jgi:hypothetical protein
MTMHVDHIDPADILEDVADVLRTNRLVSARS